VASRGWLGVDGRMLSFNRARSSSLSLRASKGQDEVGRKFFRRGGQTETFPEDGCWQLIGNIFFRYQECLRRMEDVGQRGRSSRIPEVGYRKGEYSLRMESEVKKISSLRFITSGRILRRSTRLSIDYRMAWWNMREWKKILRNILMLCYIKKRVLMLMLIRETINHSKGCGKCRNLSNECS
jgi:hypothetical protein